MAERDNIQMRAAAYFGAQADPRATFRVGRYKVIVVVPHGLSRAVGIYSEEGREPRGEFLYFTGGLPPALLDALR